MANTKKCGDGVKDKKDIPFESISLLKYGKNQFFPWDLHAEGKHKHLLRNGARRLQNILWARQEKYGKWLRNIFINIL